MAENNEGPQATEQELDELMAYLGYPNSAPAANTAEPTEESKVIDDICRNLGI